MNCPTCKNQMKSYVTQDTVSILCRVCPVRKELCPSCTWPQTIKKPTKEINHDQPRINR